MADIHLVIGRACRKARKAHRTANITILIPHGKHFSDADKRLEENNTFNAQVVGYRFENLKMLLGQQSLPIPSSINFIFWIMCFATYSKSSRLTSRKVIAV
jgi:hypothetical protein